VEGNGIEPDREVPPDGMAAEDGGRPPERPYGNGGSLQDGIVEDGLIDPTRDRQLTASLRYLRAAGQGGGLIQRNDPIARR
jgi:carboxyl-terminal processing protease